MTKEQRTLVAPLRKYLKKVGKNNPISNFKIKGGLVDLINYNKVDKTFDIVECKIANNPVRIGQTVGQILTYYSIIADNGRRFFKSVWGQAKDWLTLEEEEKILNEKRARIRLYVCFPDKETNKYRSLLDNLGNTVSVWIGVISVCRGEVKTAREADVLIVPVKAVYNKREFLERLKEDIKEGTDRIRVSETPGRVVKFNFVHPGIHFEVWFKKREEDSIPIEIGLHLELGDCRRQERIIKELQRRKKEIKNGLRNATLEGWGKKVKWYKVYERYPYRDDINRIDEKVLVEVEGKLLRYIRTLRPILQNINWGRSKRRKKAN
jgi:hypothetical protein